MGVVNWRLFPGFVIFPQLFERSHLVMRRLCRVVYILTARCLFFLIQNSLRLPRFYSWGQRMSWTIKVWKSFSANFDSVVIAIKSPMIISSIICYLTINDDNILGYFGFHLRDPWRDSWRDASDDYLRHKLARNWLSLFTFSLSVLSCTGTFNV